MIIKVFSRQDIEEGIIMDIQEKNPEYKVAVISIKDTKMDRLVRVLARKYVPTLRLDFDDVDRDYGNPVAYFVIRPNQAKQIVDFVKKCQEDKIDFLAVHCEAGISRSSGCAAACSIMIGQKDTEFFKHPYIPNIKVYRSILNAWVGG